MSPSRVAVVASRWVFEPASGSVMAKAIFVVPVARPGSHRFFSWSLPNRARMVPQIAGETIMRKSGQPRAVISSRTSASS